MEMETQECCMCDRMLPVLVDGSLPRHPCS